MILPEPALTFTPRRAAGLARWAAFLPEAGRRYAERRNFDGGPGHRANVSALSRLSARPPNGSRACAPRAPATACRGRATRRAKKHA